MKTSKNSNKNNLKKFFLNATLILTASIFFSAASFARPAKDIRSIHDLPKVWTGEAGGLIIRVPAQLTIIKVISVLEKIENGKQLRVRYSIEGELTFGERIMKVTEFEFSNVSYQGDESGVLILKLNDPISPRWSGSFSYDEVSQTYTLKEFFSQNNQEHIRLIGKN